MTTPESFPPRMCASPFGGRTKVLDYARALTPLGRCAFVGDNWTCHSMRDGDSQFCKYHWGRRAGLLPIVMPTQRKPGRPRKNAA